MGALKNRFFLYLALTRVDKPECWLLLMWPTWWGLWMASAGAPPLFLFFVFTAGSLLMHSAGCAINDFADRDIDCHVERTKGRPLASRQLHPWEAIGVALVLLLLALILVLSLNWLTVWLAGAALLVAVTYPWFKRFFFLPQAWLGIAFGFGIPMAFSATQGKIPATAWCLMVCNFFWTIAYDTEYAMVDRNDDLKIGIKTAAISFGRYDVFAIMTCYAAMLSVFAVTGWYAGLGRWFFFACGLAASGVVFQYFLIRSRDRMRCLSAFRWNNGIGFILFLGILLDYALI
ncbi:MAG: 4-hydroxybenzoate octaprenyltransferase [Burkholderiaceae bacterium]|jgi:4-hydroxybenzoate polyprenyltransferase|nr:4-hydroxybenzoate octaprenyltransferase [Burkholderiaceae bacterium]